MNNENNNNSNVGGNPTQPQDVTASNNQEMTDQQYLAWFESLALNEKIEILKNKQFIEVPTCSGSGSSTVVVNAGGGSRRGCGCPESREGSASGVPDASVALALFNARAPKTTTLTAEQKEQQAQAIAKLSEFANAPSDASIVRIVIFESNGEATSAGFNMAQQRYLGALAQTVYDKATVPQQTQSGETLESVLSRLEEMKQEVAALKQQQQSSSDPVINPTTGDQTGSTTGN